MAKKEVDGVVVEAKSILTALKIIKTVCEDNNCPNCPFGKMIHYAQLQTRHLIHGKLIVRQIHGEH